MNIPNNNGTKAARKLMKKARKTRVGKSSSNLSQLIEECRRKVLPAMCQRKWKKTIG